MENQKTAWEIAQEESAVVQCELDADAEFHGLPEHEVIAPEVSAPLTTLIPFDVAMQSILDENNANVLQINDLIQLVEDNDIVIANMQKEVATVAALREQISKLTDQLVIKENMLDVILKSNTEKSLIITRDAERMKEVSKLEDKNVQLQAFFTDSKDELTRLQKVEAKADKAADKAAKDIKALKANKADMFNLNKELRKRIANLQSDNAQYRGTKERQKEWIEVYRNTNDEHLILHPMRQDVGDEVQNGGNVVLLYTCMTGAYITAAYSEEHGVAFSSFLNLDNKLSERTKTTILNNSIRPSAEVVEFAKKWLKKVNIDQKAMPVSADVQLCSEKLNKEKDSD